MEKRTLHNTVNVLVLSAKSRHDHMQSVTIPSCSKIFQFIVHPMCLHLCLFPVFSEFFCFVLFIYFCFAAPDLFLAPFTSHEPFGFFYLACCISSRSHSLSLILSAPQKLSCFNTNYIMPGIHCLFLIIVFKFTQN